MLVLLAAATLLFYPGPVVATTLRLEVSKAMSAPSPMWARYSIPLERRADPGWRVAAKRPRF